MSVDQKVQDTFIHMSGALGGRLEGWAQFDFTPSPRSLRPLHVVFPTDHQTSHVAAQGSGSKCSKKRGNRTCHSLKT